MQSKIVFSSPFILLLVTACGGGGSSSGAQDNANNGTNPQASTQNPALASAGNVSGESTSSSSGVPASSSTGGVLPGTSIPAPGTTDNATNPPSGNGSGPVSGPVSGGQNQAGSEGCRPLDLKPGTNASGFMSEGISWFDAQCHLRSMLLVRNDAKDPAGFMGGYVRSYSYEADGKTRVANATGNADHPGFGYLVNHFNNGSSSVSSRRIAGKYKTVLAGKHHFIHQYEWDLKIGAGTVHATVQWFVHTGADHPVWSVTYDSSAAGANVVNADSRSPYGELLWDSNVKGSVEGLGWGDQYKFRTLSSPVTMASKWDYTAPNTVPHVLEWSNTADAEMGIVQTLPQAQKPAGGFWFTNNWGKTSQTKVSEGSADSSLMPESWNWPFQLNQYELPYVTTSKRIAWGTNYGAVGQNSYPALGYGKNLSGFPYQSYSVAIVLGKHSTRAVESQVAEQEVVSKTSVVATLGKVATEGPGGVGRSDSVAYDFVGYNPVYGVWEMIAESDAGAAMVMNISSGNLHNPTILMRGYSKAVAPIVTLNGTDLKEDVDYFATVDSASQRVWVTLNKTLSGQVSLSVR